MIEWTEPALGQLDQARHHIEISNSANVASKVVMQILATIERLDSFPMMGRLGRVRGTRELVIPGTPFIAACAVEKSRVVVLAIYQ